MLPRLEDNFNDKQTTTMARIGAEYTRIPYIYGFQRVVDSNTRVHNICIANCLQSSVTADY